VRYVAYTLAGFCGNLRSLLISPCYNALYVHQCVLLNWLTTDECCFSSTFCGDYNNEATHLLT